MAINFRTKLNPYVFIDGTNLCYRFFYSPDMADDSQDAIPRWFRLLEEYRPRFSLPPCKLIVVFDHPTKSSKKCELEEYKAHRPPPPQELTDNLKLAIRLTAAVGIPVFLDEALEADQAIGRLVGQARAEERASYVISSDKDLMQLVREEEPYTILFRPEGGGNYTKYTAKRVTEKYGVTPKQIAAYLAMVGDKSDNLAGVAGIGPKKAVTILTSGRPLIEIIESPKTKDEIKLSENADLFVKTLNLTKLSLEPMPMPESFGRDTALIRQYVRKYPVLNAFSSSI